MRVPSERSAFVWRRPAKRRSSASKSDSERPRTSSRRKPRRRWAAELQKTIAPLLSTAITASARSARTGAVGENGVMGVPQAEVFYTPSACGCPSYGADLLLYSRLALCSHRGAKRGRKRRGRGRLDEVAVHAVLQHRVVLVARLLIDRRHHEDARRVAVHRGADEARHLEAVHLRHEIGRA